MPYSFLINNGYMHFFLGGLVTDFLIINAHVQGEAGRSLGNKQKSNIRMLFGRFFTDKNGNLVTRVTIAQGRTVVTVSINMTYS